MAKNQSHLVNAFWMKGKKITNITISANNDSSSIIDSGLSVIRELCVISWLYSSSQWLPQLLYLSFSGVSDGASSEPWNSLCQSDVFCLWVIHSFSMQLNQLVTNNLYNTLEERGTQENLIGPLKVWWLQQEKAALEVELTDIIWSINQSVILAQFPEWHKGV